MVENAYAKVNWSLAVTGRRDDGYHLLDMVMQTVSLHDTLVFAPSDTLSLRVEDGDASLAGEHNLVLRAARLLQLETGTQQGAAVTLTKRIPSGAGLGGGSADAAATLRALNMLWGLGLSTEKLSTLGLRLGADIPFCFAGGAARVRGIGEKIEPLLAVKPFHLVIVQPGEGLSTPVVFRAYDELDRLPPNPTVERVAEAVKQGNEALLAQAMGNALQGSAVALRPEIAHCVLTLEKLGALRAQMTGSGSAVIALFDDAKTAGDAATHCAGIWERCFAARTV